MMPIHHILFTAIFLGGNFECKQHYIDINLKGSIMGNVIKLRINQVKDKPGSTGFQPVCQAELC